MQFRTCVKPRKWLFLTVIPNNCSEQKFGNRVRTIVRNPKKEVFYNYAFNLIYFVFGEEILFSIKGGAASDVTAPFMNSVVCSRTQFTIRSLTRPRPNHQIISFSHNFLQSYYISILSRSLCELSGLIVNLYPTGRAGWKFARDHASNPFLAPSSASILSFFAIQVDFLELYA